MFIPCVDLYEQWLSLTWPVKINNIDATDSLPRGLEHRNQWIVNWRSRKRVQRKGVWKWLTANPSWESSQLTAVVLKPSPWGPERWLDPCPKWWPLILSQRCTESQITPRPLTNKWKLRSIILSYSGRVTASQFHLPVGLNWLESWISSLTNFWFFFPYYCKAASFPPFFLLAFQDRDKQFCWCF